MCIRDRLESEDRPDGFFAINDETASGILYACKLVGSDGDGAFTGVAQQNHAVVHRNFILLHGIQDVYKRQL